MTILNFPKADKSYIVRWNRELEPIKGWEHSRQRAAFGLNNEGMILHKCQSADQALERVAKEYTFSKYFLTAEELKNDNGR